MKTFDQFVTDSASHGTNNLVFASGMYSLIDDLEQVVAALRKAGLPFEVVGGVAVNAHISTLHRSRSFVTRDIDLLVHRGDLQQIAETAEVLGYRAKKMMGGYALMRPEQDFAESIHLLFVGEKSKSTQPYPHPELQPQEKELYGLVIPVAPLKDLLQMKLSALRPKDVIHIETLDDLGLITPDLETGLPPELRKRLAEARQQIAASRPDLEG